MIKQSNSEKELRFIFSLEQIKNLKIEMNNDIKYKQNRASVIWLARLRPLHRSHE